jgi:hypothetical protein
MRASGVRGVLIYCADFKCSHWIKLNADHWADDVRLSDLESQFVCTACGHKGADIRPDFNWDKQPGHGKTMREAFTQAILNDPRFVEAKPSSKGSVIGGARPPTKPK